jgi:hypothetical protein
MPRASVTLFSVFGFDFLAARRGFDSCDMNGGKQAGSRGAIHADSGTASRAN